MADQRMTFTLTGRDRLSPALSSAGRSADQLSRDLRDVSDSGDALGRSSQRNGASIGGFMRILGSVAGAAASAGTSLGGGAAGAKAFGAAVAVTALPALGALVPMLAGAAVVAGAAKLAFSGVGEAVALAGKDSKAYAEKLDAMSGPQRNFTKALVGAKKELSGVGEEVRRIALPPLTKAIRESGPALRAFRGGLKDGAGVIGDFGREFGKVLSDKSFGDVLRRNFRLGTDFFSGLARPVATFTRSLFEFGAASKPTLDAFQEGISGLLSKGIPGFFDGLKSGIKGSAAMFRGLFSAVNDVLPAIGELVGAIAESLGPALGKIMRTAGKTGAGAFRGLAGAVRYMRPLFEEMAGAVRIAHVVLRTAGTIAKQVGGVLIRSLWPSFGKAKDAVGPLQTLANWLDRNKDAVDEFALRASNAIIDFVAAVISNIPGIIGAIRDMSNAVLTGFDGIVSGAAKSFGWVPGVGDKLKDANESFDRFKNGFIGGLDAAEQKSQEFADRVIPRLEGNKLRLNKQEWDRKLRDAQRRVDNLKQKKKTAVGADKRELDRKIRDAQARVNALKQTRPPSLSANASPLHNAVRAARAAIDSIRSKTITITAIVRRAGDLAMGLFPGRAHGGLVPAYAGGGAMQAFPYGGQVRGPGTSTSDSIRGIFSRGVADVSSGEYVIQASAVRRYGVGLMDAINNMQFARSAAVPLTAGAAAAAPAPSVTHSPTYNIYPQRADFTTQQLEAMQRRLDLQHRVRRPR
ncbi:hypothetical protein [Streptomyces synnematoformans]|uniref:Phage tail protein n=1 Tax=Streptomyces synnematoformans TaxID=415721 RepID=A0ABN1ZQU1_9ACTN